MKLKSVIFYEYLEPDTKVQVKNHRGIIISTNNVKDQFNQPIYSYTVKYTEKYDQGWRKWKQCKEKIETVNYAFVKKVTQ